jgi:hypothetical protein
MTRYILGYLGKWQEKWDDEAMAITRAEDLAAEGVSVEVVRRRFGFHSFLTAFPESDREAYRARWRSFSLWFDNSSGGGGSGDGGNPHHHFNSIGGHGGGGHGGGHGGGGHGGH